MLELEDMNLVGRKRLGVVETIGVYSSMHSAVSRSVCASLLVHVRRSTIILALPDICPTEGSLLTDGDQVT